MNDINNGNVIMDFNLTLSELIGELIKMPQDAVVERGFAKPMSYRGYYDEVAFEPARNVTIGSMLCHAMSADGESFTGYKGGTFEMRGSTPCWLAHYGNTGDAIEPETIDNWKEEICLKLSE